MSDDDYAAFEVDNIRKCEMCRSEDEDETVYATVVGVDDLCGTVPHLQMFKTYSTEEGDYKTTYFQTYGGGPEGGYFQRTFYGLNGFDPVDEVYKVERNWGTPFTVERIEGVVDLSGDEQSCRIVPKP